MGITPNQIADIGYSEIYLNYYDIFVHSKSTSYNFEENFSTTYPDENYAREIMQLFTIGIPMLNVDGTLQLDSEGVATTTYDNTDIQNLARAWTGFTRQNVRSNYEALGDEWLNRMDPMQIIGSWRILFRRLTCT